MIDLTKVKKSDLWYVLGYIATDGSLSVDGRHINITSRDRKHLYYIRNALNLKNKIGRKARGFERQKRFSQLQIGDVNLYRYLVKVGFTPRKSLTLGPISIDNNFFIDFLRGVIDGDGNISTWIHRTNRHRQWCLRIYSGSSIFIEWLNNKIEETFVVEGKLYSEKKNDRRNFIYVLKYGKIAAVKLLKQVYYPGCLSLERKFLQAQLLFTSSQ